MVELHRTGLDVDAAEERRGEWPHRSVSMPLTTWSCVMFENRSFDNLLGRLYEPGEVESFEGVIGKDLSNPIPEWAEHGAERGVVPYGVAKDMNTP